jgi:hypothetical protein
VITEQLTPEQDKALGVMREAYGDARWEPTTLHYATRCVRITGVCFDPENYKAETWVVKPDGKLTGVSDMRSKVMREYLSRRPSQKYPMVIPVEAIL